MTTFKFSELSEAAKQKAMSDYQTGWLETHPDEPFTEEEILEFHEDNEDEWIFDENGNQLDDSELEA